MSDIFMSDIILIIPKSHRYVNMFDLTEACESPNVNAVDTSGAIIVPDLSSTLHIIKNPPKGTEPSKSQSSRAFTLRFVCRSHDGFSRSSVGWSRNFMLLAVYAQPHGHGLQGTVK